MICSGNHPTGSAGCWLEPSNFLQPAAPLLLLFCLPFLFFSHKYRQEQEQHGSRGVCQKSRSTQIGETIDSAARPSREQNNQGPFVIINLPSISIYDVIHWYHQNDETKCRSNYLPPKEEEEKHLKNSNAAGRKSLISTTGP